MKDMIVLKQMDSGTIIEAYLPAVLGRGVESDIRLNDPSVSRIHARIDSLGSNLYKITDLDSSNGVFLNGIKIKDSGFFKNGDVLTLGNTRLMVVGKGQPTEVSNTIILGSTNLEEKRHLDAKRLNVIYDIAVKMSECENLDRLLTGFFQAISDIIQFDRGFLVTVEDSGKLRVIFPKEVDGMPISKSIAKKVLLSGNCLLLKDAMSDSNFATEESIIAMQIRSAIVAPLRFRERIFGLIYIERGHKNAFDQADMELLRTVAFIIGPIIENTKLHQELEKRYNETVAQLKETETRLIEMERLASFARLAQVIAHEIRNPLMIAGGLLNQIGRRIDQKDEAKIQRIRHALEKIDRVLKEVDCFVNIKAPEPKLIDLGFLMQNCMQKNQNRPPYNKFRIQLNTNKTGLLVYLDQELFKRAVGLIMEEISEKVPSNRDIPVTLRRMERTVEIVFGEEAENVRYIEIFDDHTRSKPWHLGLFLTMAYKIVADHGGRILINASGNDFLPIKIQLFKANFIGQSNEN